MKNKPDNRLPIGIFDSGMGGLTVMRALRARLPGENLLYLGDTARLPYGTKSADTVTRYAVTAAQALTARGIKMLVVACNSSSAYCLPTLKEYLGIPVIGVIDPGAEAASRCTKNGRVGIIGTTATVQSGAYQHALLGYRRNAQVFAKACPLFVPLVEEGWTKHKVAREVAA